ncbi:MAG: HPr family phosphocarrier protein [Isosphaeraceae bacterium]
MTETSTRICRQAVIIDPLGLHLRPAAKVAVLAKSFRSDIRVVHKGAMADGKSLLDLLILAVECNAKVDLVAHGPDAAEAIDALADLIEAGFGAPSQRAAAAA